MQDKWDDWCRTTHTRSYRTGGGLLSILGAILIVGGLLLLFLCVPGWFWAALAGAALILLGGLLITIGNGR